MGSNPLGSSDAGEEHSFTSNQNDRRDGIRLGKRPVGDCRVGKRRSRSCGQRGGRDGRLVGFLKQEIITKVKKKR